MSIPRATLGVAALLAFGILCNAGRNFLISPSWQGGWVSTGSLTATPQTLVVWVRPSVTNGSGKTLLTTTGAANHYQLAGISVGLNRWYVASRAGGSESYAASLTPPALNQWTHIAAVFASGTSRVIYVNGVPEGTNATSVSPTLTAMSLGIRCDGGFPNSGSPSIFEGDLALAAIYNVALTTSEIEQLAGGGSPAKAVHPTKIRPQSLIAEWSLDGGTAFERNSVGLPVFLTNLPARAAGPTIIR
jgi:hypothetical protein